MKAILIDLDGTLADSIPAFYQAYLDFLAREGHQGSYLEFQELIGPTLSQVVASLRERYQLRQTEESYREAIRSAYRDQVQLFPHARQFLEQAKEQGWLVAIVTSAEQELASTFLQAQKLEGLYDALITAEGLPKSKPDPAIYQKALSVLAISPHEAIAIEDSPNGLRSALDAGIQTIRFGKGGWKKVAQLLQD